jgi:hypothetical protein
VVTIESLLSGIVGKLIPFFGLDEQKGWSGDVIIEEPVTFG